MRKITFIFFVLSSIFFLAACVPQPRVVQTRTVIVQTPPVMASPGCMSGCCGQAYAYGYPTCGRGYWSCSEYNLQTNQCGLWDYRSPYYYQRTVAVY